MEEFMEKWMGQCQGQSPLNSKWLTILTLVTFIVTKKILILLVSEAYGQGTTVPCIVG